MFLLCLVFAMPLCASVYMCLVVTCGEWLTSWLSFEVSNCEFITFPLVSWVSVSIPDLWTLTYIEFRKWVHFLKSLALFTLDCYCIDIN